MNGAITTGENGIKIKVERKRRSTSPPLHPRSALFSPRRAPSKWSNALQIFITGGNGDAHPLTPPPPPPPRGLGLAPASVPRTGAPMPLQTLPGFVILWILFFHFFNILNSGLRYRPTDALHLSFYHFSPLFLATMLFFSPFFPIRAFLRSSTCRPPPLPPPRYFLLPSHFRPPSLHVSTSRNNAHCIMQVRDRL